MSVAAFPWRTTSLSHMAVVIRGTAEENGGSCNVSIDGHLLSIDTGITVANAQTSIGAFTAGDSRDTIIRRLLAALSDELTP